MDSERNRTSKSERERDLQARLEAIAAGSCWKVTGGSDCAVLRCAFIVGSRVLNQTEICVITYVNAS